MPLGKKHNCISAIGTEVNTIEVSNTLFILPLWSQHPLKSKSGKSLEGYHYNHYNHNYSRVTSGMHTDV